MGIKHSCAGYLTEVIAFHHHNNLIISMLVIIPCFRGEKTDAQRCGMKAGFQPTSFQF